LRAGTQPGFEDVDGASVVRAHTGRARDDYFRFPIVVHVGYDGIFAQRAGKTGDAGQRDIIHSCLAFAVEDPQRSLVTVEQFKLPVLVKVKQRQPG
jgi:hypothetical protein